VHAIRYGLGILLLLASLGCDQENQSAKPPAYDTGYADGVWAAKAQKSKGRAADLKQSLNGRRDLAIDAGFEPGDERDEYREGFSDGYNQEFGVKP
jgi:hypothetical protein